MLAIFEPVISLINKEEIEPTSLILVDNSISVKNYSNDDSLKIIEGITNLNERLNGNIDLYSFGKVLRKINNDQIDQISFDDSITNISPITDLILDKKENISSVILLSDGNYNSGSDPSYELSKLGIPIFTVGIGDSIQKQDVEIRNILYNKFLYENTESVIKSIILNNGFENENVIVSLKEGNSIIEQKNILLSEKGISFIDFNYKPENSGEKKLSIEISSLENEASYANNQKSFYINVIDNKLSISIISSAPSADAKFIYNSLKQNDELEINRSIQIRNSKFLDDFNNEEILKTDILFLIGFPGKNSPPNLINFVKQKLENKTPFFIVVNENTDLQKLINFNKFLSFRINQISNNYTRAFLNISDFNSPLLGNNIEERTLWNELPPFLRNSSAFKSNSESNVIAKLKIGNTNINEPVIVTRNTAGEKSIAILAGEIWRWKLNDKQNSELLFDNFLNTAVKWLRDESNKDKFILSTDKKIYSTSENIFITAELYDEALNPLANAEIEAEIINSKNEIIPFRFNYESNGLYEYNFENLPQGNYRINAKALINDENYLETNYSLSVENSNLEKNSTIINFEFLNNLSTVSNGKFYYLKDINNTLTSANNINRLFKKEKTEKTEFKFWSNEIILFLIIFFFALEWFLRKRAGML